MYLRWQYLGPAWRTIDGRGRSRRQVDKQPAEGQARYRLAVVESRRDKATHKPRVHVVQYLGVVDELALHPNYVGPAEAYHNRNSLIAVLAARLADGVRKGGISEDQRTRLRAAINAAFPKMQPPDGYSYVVVPARVRQKALANLERDVQFAWKRGEKQMKDDLMLDMMRRAMREAEEKEAAEEADPEERKQRESLRQVRKTMAVFGKEAKEAFWKFCAEHDVPTERRDAVWAER